MNTLVTELAISTCNFLTSFKEKFIGCLVGAVVIISLPYLHIGTYENPGNTRYKHVFFNSTWQTFRIWVITVMFMMLASESIRYLIALARIKKIRNAMFALYLINIYPHYYSWWSYFNYYNDDFYDQFMHQAWFTITELVSSGIVLNLCDRRNDTVSWKVLAIISVNVMHIMVGGMDQFISNVIYGEGTGFRITRDVGFMIPDCLHVIIPACELYKLAKRKQLKIYKMCTRRELLLCFLFTSLLTVLAKVL